MATNLTDLYGDQLADNNGNNLLSQGTSVPADGTAGYNTGAIFQETDGTSPAVAFVNTGTTSSAAFRPVSLGASTNNGVNGISTIRFQFDPSANTAQKAAGTYACATVPSGAVVFGGFAKVDTAFTSSGSTAAVALAFYGASTANIIASATVGGAPWSTTGTKVIVPNATSNGAGYVATTATVINAVVANEALTAGKVTGWVNYLT